MIEDRKRIKRRKLEREWDNGERWVVKIDILGLRDEEKMMRKSERLDEEKIEKMEERKESDRKIEDLSGGEDEIEVRRRILKSIKKKVEGGGGKNVKLVDDIEFVERWKREIEEMIDDIENVVDECMRGRVNIDEIEMEELNDRMEMIERCGKIDSWMIESIGIVIERERKNKWSSGIEEKEKEGKNKGMWDEESIERIEKSEKNRIMEDEIIEIMREIFEG